MDVNIARIAVTLAALGAFLAIVVWSYLPSRRERLDAEARRILQEADE
jgi:cbb3-type cytochrome oxidase subunit 3